MKLIDESHNNQTTGRQNIWKTLPARDLQDSINIGCSRYSSVQIKDLAEQIKLIDIIWDLAKYLQKLLHKDYKILPV